MPQSSVVCTLLYPIHIKPLWGQDGRCSVSILLMEILKRTEAELLALLIQVSRTDGNTACTQEPSRQLIFAFSQSELDNHTPLVSFQSWINVKIWEEGTGNLKLPFLGLFPLTFIKIIQIYDCSFFPRLTIVLQELVQGITPLQGLIQRGSKLSIRKEKGDRKRCIRRKLTTYTNNDLDLLFFDML